MCIEWDVDTCMVSIFKVKCTGVFAYFCVPLVRKFHSFNENLLVLFLIGTWQEKNRNILLFTSYPCPLIPMRRKFFFLNNNSLSVLYYGVMIFKVKSVIPGLPYEKKNIDIFFVIVKEFLFWPVAWVP
jgi:hypothetical protein